MSMREYIKAWADHKYTSKESNIVAFGVFVISFAFMFSVFFYGLYGVFRGVLWTFQSSPGQLTEALYNIASIALWGLLVAGVATFCYWQLWGQRQHDKFIEQKIQYLERYIRQHPIKAAWEILALIDRNIKTKNKYWEYTTYVALAKQCMQRDPRVRAYMIRALAKDPNHQQWYSIAYTDASEYNRYIHTLLAELLPPEMRNLVHVYSPKELRDFIIQNTSSKGTWLTTAKPQEALDCTDML